MRRAIVLGLAATLGVSAGCFDAKTKDQPCLADADCGGKEVCNKTDYQRTQLNNIGWCRPEQSCAVGRQPGCSCRVTGQGVTECGEDPFLPDTLPDGRVLTPSSEDPAACSCVYECPEDESVECTAGDESSGSTAATSASTTMTD